MRGWRYLGRVSDIRGDQLWIRSGLVSSVAPTDIVALSPSIVGVPLRHGYASVRAVATGIEVNDRPDGDAIVVDDIDAIAAACAGDYVFVATAIGEEAFT